MSPERLFGEKGRGSHVSGATRGRRDVSEEFLKYDGATECRKSDAADAGYGGRGAGSGRCGIGRCGSWTFARSWGFDAGGDAVGGASNVTDIAQDLPLKSFIVSATLSELSPFQALCGGEVSVIALADDKCQSSVAAVPCLDSVDKAS